MTYLLVRHVEILMIDIAVLLNPFLSPIKQIRLNNYFYEKTTDTFFHRKETLEGIKFIKTDNRRSGKFQFYKTNDGYFTISIKVVLCFIKNGLPNGVRNLLDKSIRVKEDDCGRLYWVTYSEFRMAKSLSVMSDIYKKYPELKVKDGFYDEGVIEYLEKPGFFFLPLTNGTVVFNPTTEEALYVHSDVTLKPQYNGKRKDKKYTLNKRLSENNRTMFFVNRAVAYLTISVPERFKTPGLKIRDIVEKLEVDHKDGNPANNDKNNLQYLTPKENLEKKLDQEMDPRVIPTTWKSPEGEIIRFRSMLKAAEQINTTIRTIKTAIFGWKKIRTVNGWTLVKGSVEHPLEDCYSYFENVGINRLRLRSMITGCYVLDVKKKKHICFKTITEVSKYLNISLSSLEVHLNSEGPLTPFKNYIIFPVQYAHLLTKCGLTIFS